MVCQNGDIRLQGGSELTGRVEICNNEVWGSVCDGSFDNTDAGVVCGQLGFAPIGKNTIIMYVYQ